MIANHSHRCGGSLAGEAYTVCISQGCASFALCCSGKECDCRKNHKGHNMQMLSDILDIAMEPAQLPDDVKKMEKEINVLIDELINNLQQLKASHREHIEQHMSKQLGSGPLLRKLRQREPLELKEGTGDSFHRLTNELGKATQMPSPYSISKEQLQKQATAVKGQIAAACLQIQQMWAHEQIPSQPTKQYPFQFSTFLKHQQIKLRQDNLRATGTYLAFVEPSLPMNAVSTIRLRPNKVSDRVYVGVCLRDTAQPMNFIPNFGENGHGLYMHDDNGFIISDSIWDDNCRYLSSVRFSSGEVVTVSLQPETGLLTFSSNGKSFKLRTDIRDSTVQPVHFCIYLEDCDISIVE